MPSLDLLLLPLLGGFIFVSNWHPTKYSAFRSAGYRLIFMAAVAGAVFLLLSAVAVTAIYSTAFGQWAAEAWHWAVPYRHSGKAALSFLVGAFFWYPLNLLGQLEWFSWLSDNSAVDRAIDRKHDPLERLLRRALGSQQTIVVTVKNGKVYIGQLTTTINPAFGLESIHLLLRRSGHRDPDTQELTIDVDYDKTHEEIRDAAERDIRRTLLELLEEHPSASTEELIRLAEERVNVRERMNLRNYEIVILISEIVSVNFFDIPLYDEHFKQDEAG